MCWNSDQSLLVLYKRELKDAVWNKPRACREERFWPVARIAWEMWFQFSFLQRAPSAIHIELLGRGRQEELDRT